ncbi:MAG: MFS transporter, partial [Corynebacterium casei]|nr:MFS transporter [Corynebacterium casei]
MTSPDSNANSGKSLPHESRNASRFVIANGMQNLGDELVAAKTVLPWLFQSAGVPAALTGLLVPIRESGSMLPQAALTQ